jgi:outer membrane protein assembly factor BamB
MMIEARVSRTAEHNRSAFGWAWIGAAAAIVVALLSAPLLSACGPGDAANGGDSEAGPDDARAPAAPTDTSDTSDAAGAAPAAPNAVWSADGRVERIPWQAPGFPTAERLGVPVVKRGPAADEGWPVVTVLPPARLPDGATSDAAIGARIEAFIAALPVEAQGYATATWRAFGQVTFERTPAALEALARFPELAANIIEERPLGPHTAELLRSGRIDELAPGGASGLSLTGSGLRFGAWDVGPPLKNHEQLKGRIFDVDGTTVANHATHISGILMGSGLGNPSVVGAAQGALMWAFDFTADQLEFIQYGGAFVATNHSYGPLLGWQSVNCPSYLGWYGGSNTRDPVFGKYSTLANQADTNIRNSDTLQVWAAGNQRSVTPPAAGSPHYHGNKCFPVFTDSHVGDAFDTIGGSAIGKNVLSVGAINSLPGTIDPAQITPAAFTSFGPADDGRVKPEIVADGVNVLSAYSASTTAYGRLTGTSQATPGVTATLALLQDLYARNNGQIAMRAAELKALVIQTAVQPTGVLGPSYTTGFGALDARAAADLVVDDAARGIDAKRIRSGAMIDSTPVTFKTEAISPGNPIKLTMVWLDPPGNVNVAAANDPTPALVNDLDVELVAPDNTTLFYPWSLSAAAPSAAATRTSANRRDPVEQVLVTSAQNTFSGAWTVRVKLNGTLQNAAAQPFAIVASVGLVQAEGQPPILGLPRFFDFTTTYGQPTTQGFVTPKNLGGGTLYWQTSSTVPWATFGPQFGQEGESFWVKPTDSFFSSPGFFTFPITVSSNDPGGARKVQITLEIKCVPSCGDAVCGDDGCGGSCGQCAARADRCDGGRCQVCEPRCDGQACGHDGCLGSCGDCGQGRVCNPSGQCLPDPNTTGDLNGAQSGSVHPMFRRTPNHNAASPLASVRGNPSPAWSYNPGSNAVIRWSSPAIAADGTVYVGASSNRLLALNTDGSLKWARTLSTSVFTSPAIGTDGTVYVSSFDATLHAVSPDGNLKWSAPTGFTTLSSPLVGGDGTIYIGANGLSAFGADGSRKWLLSAPGEMRATPVFLPNGSIVAAGFNGTVLGVTPDGRELWRFTAGNTVFSSPATDAAGRVFFGSSDGLVYALSSLGQKLWTFATPSPVNSSPAVFGGKVFVGGGDSKFYALDAATGASVWTTTVGGVVNSSPVIDSGGWVYFGASDNKLYGLKPDGVLGWNFALNGAIDSSPSIRADGSLVVGAADGTVTAVTGCVPLCGATRQCGDDGCGGTCGGCDDGNTCTVDSCVNFQCTFDAAPREGTGCNDGKFCTLGDACKSGVCTGAANPCTDTVACTLDRCDAVSDKCVNTPDNSACDNGIACDGSESCDATLGCLLGAPPIDGCGAVIRFTGAVSSSWGDARNWSPQAVPGATDATFIPADAVRPLVLDADRAVGWLYLAPGGTFDLAGFGLTVAGDLSLAGTTKASPAARVVFTGDRQQTFVPAGSRLPSVTVDKTGGAVQVEGPFNLAGALTVAGGTLRLGNGGVVVAGDVQVTAGELDLGEGVFAASGTLNVGGIGVLDCDGSGLQASVARFSVGSSANVICDPNLSSGGGGALRPATDVFRVSGAFENRGSISPGGLKFRFVNAGDEQLLRPGGTNFAAVEVVGAWRVETSLQASGAVTIDGPVRFVDPVLHLFTGELTATAESALTFAATSALTVEGVGRLLGTTTFLPGVTVKFGPGKVHTLANVQAVGQVFQGGLVRFASTKETGYYGLELTGAIDLFNIDIENLSSHGLVVTGAPFEGVAGLESVRFRTGEAAPDLTYLTLASEAFGGATFDGLLFEYNGEPTMKTVANSTGRPVTLINFGADPGQIFGTVTCTGDIVEWGNTGVDTAQGLTPPGP